MSYNGFLYPGIIVGNEYSKEILGGKGFGLAEMSKLDIPVPEFVVIPTTLCVEYMADPQAVLKKLPKIAEGIVNYFKKDCGFLPLLSVRSGARVSMPGMMDTILNVGIGDEEVKKFTSTMNTRQANDCMRRFYHMYATTVLGMENLPFEHAMTAAREEAGVETDAQLDQKMLGKVANQYKEMVKSQMPGTAAKQIESCILAVMNSWNSERAVAYRDEMGIPHDWGTAVVVQRMVFGNMNDDSSSGVAFSRDPSDGFDEITGEFLPNAQGEDVVAGIRTPLPLTEMSDTQLSALCDVAVQLEAHFRDMLDMEFTVEDGKLYMLQVRTAKRSARAAVRCALDMHKDDTALTRDEVFARITREQVKTLTRPVIDPKFKEKPHLTGIPGCAGVATGKAAFTVEQAVAYKEAGEPCILIRHETTPDDIKGMFASVGILTATGGHTSHAAVVARGMDKVCVTGCEQMKVASNSAVIDGDTMYGIEPGMKVTLDGTTGRVWTDIDVPVSDPTGDPLIAELVEFVNGSSGNADVFLPDSPGTVYYSSQFIGAVPPPIAKEVMVIEDMSDSNDQLLTLCGADSIGDVAGPALVLWAMEHGVKVKLFSSHATEIEQGEYVDIMPIGKGLDALLDRPVTQSEIETFFKGSMTAVRKLLAPVKLEDKFKIVGCQRYRLLSAFK
jgi:pyruvate,orthophosphate dikinase